MIIPLEALRALLLADANVVNTFDERVYAVTLPQGAPTTPCLLLQQAGGDSDPYVPLTRPRVAVKVFADSELAVQQAYAVTYAALARLERKVQGNKLIHAIQVASPATDLWDSELGLPYVLFYISMLISEDILV